ncbi:hypothetical protein AMTRI_Chr04g248420 [Amborella trichopoda]|uniref:Glabrous enhancer-binding protein-like DBD domain-containing protein n=1 Tax=Amborella trichopoda TaxID=13333 RepID=W1NKR9_AMBTC|nr:uncharacterized protein LOC18423753 [Amborella trichopoda]ERM95829.1 hypothetical protein AMTR_s00060p00077350 [Amborella trichopoda]|eukprot:XP_006828413.1 uncharacterized protein LOC18423753 [Amborella trichopoda]
MATPSDSQKLPVKRKLEPLDPPQQQPSPSATKSFQRLWCPQDEIRFLQLLLRCTSQGMHFPRDMPLFYHRVSHSLTQSYTKPQLSEKLRRLKKKFRRTSSRIARDNAAVAAMTPHERRLFGMSKRLWSGDQPTVMGPAAGVWRAVAEAFEEGVEEARASIQSRYCGVVYPRASFGPLGWMEFTDAAAELQRRWGEQRVAEMEVFSQRLKLVLERVGSELNEAELI